MKLVLYTKGDNDYVLGRDSLTVRILAVLSESRSETANEQRTDPVVWVRYGKLQR